MKTRLKEAIIQAAEQLQQSKNRTINYSMSCPVWPGLGKVVEETGELQQALGKIIMSKGSTEYFDGTDLVRPLEEELADSLASIEFLIDKACLDIEFISNRVKCKLNKFEKWKEDNQ